MQDSASNVQRLLERLKTEQDSLERWQIIHNLTQLKNDQAADLLLAIILDRRMAEEDRCHALTCLYSDEDRVADALLGLMIDISERVEVRAAAAEQLSWRSRPHTVPYYIAALCEESVEMRFWTAYGLVIMSRFVDISAALPDLDRVVAHDHAVLPGWWSVSREAMPALMHLLYTQRVLLVCADGECCCGPRAVLISPLLEYHDYQRTHQQLAETQPDIHFEQHTTLDLDPAAFAAQITERWPGARFNVCEPIPAALRLHWEIDMPNSVLFGGLHQDGYSAFLAGTDEDYMIQFARWYRGIIPQEHTLRWYGWADPGRLITEDGIAPDPLAAASSRQDE